MSREQKRPPTPKLGEDGVWALETHGSTSDSETLGAPPPKHSCWHTHLSALVQYLLLGVTDSSFYREAAGDCVLTLEKMP